MHIDAEDILAYGIDGEIVCKECASQEERQEAIEDYSNLVLRDEVEDKGVLTYCDRCQSLIK